MEITLTPNSTETIYFTGNVTQTSPSNPIQLTVSPIHHPTKTKTIFVNGFTSPLSIDQPIQLTSFQLMAAYPNPFNARINIDYSVDYNQDVLLEIFNTKGQKVSTLLNNEVPYGKHRIFWNATNNSTGIYFIKMTSGSITKNQKILYLK